MGFLLFGVPQPWKTGTQIHLQNADGSRVIQGIKLSSCKEGVYWATAQGLLAIPGHEDLVIRRMELHARSGDHASLCAEWQAYCRALASDDWGDVDPSPKMVGVWRQLSQGK